ncbi:hypothetical protein B0H11DRAFT_2257849 [Mycena galericulata]|nr:hypothetical protein B0H11DRAFT_2257849 [Mycena galericulata]
MNTWFCHLVLAPLCICATPSLRCTPPVGRLSPRARTPGLILKLCLIALGTVPWPILLPIVRSQLPAPFMRCYFFASVARCFRPRVAPARFLDVPARCPDVPARCPDAPAPRPAAPARHSHQLPRHSRPTVRCPRPDAHCSHPLSRCSCAPPAVRARCPVTPASPFAAHAPMPAAPARCYCCSCPLFPPLSPATPPLLPAVPPLPPAAPLLPLATRRPFSLCLLYHLVPLPCCLHPAAPVSCAGLTLLAAVRRSCCFARAHCSALLVLHYSVSFYTDHQ